MRHAVGSGILTRRGGCVWLSGMVCYAGSVQVWMNKALEKLFRGHKRGVTR